MLLNETDFHCMRIRPNPNMSTPCGQNAGFPRANAGARTYVVITTNSFKVMKGTRMQPYTDVTALI
jgi:hypothetical protein